MLGKSANMNTASPCHSGIPG